MSNVTSNLTTRDLFGGAIVMDIPTTYTDISDFRPIPDNQEVFSDGQTDQSLIVELLEHEPNIPDEESGRYYFAEIGDCNEVDKNQMIVEKEEPFECPHLPTSSVNIAVGTQVVFKYHDEKKAPPVKPSTVKVFVGCIRLRNVASDIVVSVNMPTSVANQRVSPTESFNSSLFETIMGSFQVKDWGLFGEVGSASDMAM
jgi:hypothetical protein